MSFTNADSSTVVECAYDSMGRRAYKKVTTNGSVTLHHRYLYRGYLQIACVDLTRSHHPCLWLLTWDPSEPVATRPLAIQISGTWHTYGWDLTKNICELYGTTGYISTAYTYSPYGENSVTGNTTQPIRWSSEYSDTELGLIYYNYRHYSLKEGRWIGRDLILTKSCHLYCYVENNILNFDYLGARIILIRESKNINIKNALGYTKAREGANYCNFVSNAVISVTKQENCYIGNVTSVQEPDITIRTYVPRPGTLTTQYYHYTENAVNAIIRHENNRLESYRRADKEYFSKIGSRAIRIKGIGNTEEEAIINTRKKLEVYWNAVRGQFIMYVFDNNKNITREVDVDNRKYAKYKKNTIRKLKPKYTPPKGKRVIIGFRLLYKIGMPPSILEPEHILEPKSDVTSLDMLHSRPLNISEAPPLTPLPEGY